MSMIIPFPALLTDRETAARLGVSIETLRRLVRQGAIASYKIGRKRRFAERHLQEYLEAAECPQLVKSGPMEGSFSRSEAIRRTGTDAGLIRNRGRRAPPPSQLAISRKPSGG
ncbi:MAG: helix-turn-helix domain-containing protein [Parvularculaceae bacterium]